MSTTERPLDLKIVAKKLNVSVRSVYNYIACGDLRAIYIPGKGQHMRSAVLPSELRRYQEWLKEGA